jgi:hypothetical protein
MLGSGRIFQIAEEAISEPMIDHVPAHWAKLWGIDFGIDHPFAAALPGTGQRRDPPPPRHPHARRCRCNTPCR